MEEERTTASIAGKIPAVEPKPFYNFIKRAFDIVGSSLFMILFFWLFLIVALAIKIDDGGPVFYLSTRIGKGENPSAFTSSAA